MNYSVKTDYPPRRVATFLYKPTNYFPLPWRSIGKVCTELPKLVHHLVPVSGILARGHRESSIQKVIVSHMRPISLSGKNPPKCRNTSPKMFSLIIWIHLTIFSQIMQARGISIKLIFHQVNWWNSEPAKAPPHPQAAAIPLQWSWHLREHQPKL